MKTPLLVIVKAWAGLDRLNWVPGRRLTREGTDIVTLGEYLEEQFTLPMPANEIDDLHLPVHYLWAPSRTTASLKIPWTWQQRYGLVILG